MKFGIKEQIVDDSFPSCTRWLLQSLQCAVFVRTLAGFFELTPAADHVGCSSGATCRWDWKPLLVGRGCSLCLRDVRAFYAEYGIIFLILLPQYVRITMHLVSFKTWCKIIFFLISFLLKMGENKYHIKFGE